MKTSGIDIRPVTAKDLQGLNAVVEQAVMSWNLPERVKRLALPSYRYSTFDLQHMHLLLAQTTNRQCVGVAAWERANPEETPVTQTAVLLHGLYVEPVRHRQGIGSGLLRAVEEIAARNQYAGILVKAQRDAVAFFLARGYLPLAAEASERQFQNRFWRPL